MFRPAVRYNVWCQYNRLSALRYLSILLPTVRSALSGEIIQPDTCAPLCLLILQPTIRSDIYG
jgi:hypothetical protein